MFYISQKSDEVCVLEVMALLVPSYSIILSTWRRWLIVRLVKFQWRVLSDAGGRGLNLIQTAQFIEEGRAPRVCCYALEMIRRFETVEVPMAGT